MSLVAPKGRKHLSADALFRLVQNGFDNIPEHRLADTEIALTDALMSAFAMFSLKAPSLLAFDKERAEGNLETIYGIEQVPCDTHMREILDPVFPESLRPVFKRVFTQLQRGKALESMSLLEGHYLLALDGTRYFSSKTMHCASCLHKVHRNGSVTYYHQMLGAAIVHPDMRAVIPLMPEAIVKHDGTAKNDCERNAAKRFIAKLRKDHPHLKFIVTEDSLSSNAPHIETLHDHDLHYILGVKEGDHAFLFNQVQAAEHAGRVTYEERHDRAAGRVHRFRFVNQVPLNASNSDVRVNFIAYWERDADRVQHFSWVTDLRVNKRNVYALMRGGRARWKIDNETFNTLKNQGYHFEHNYGHGMKNLSVVFATVMMLAFLVDQTQQLCCVLFQAVWAKLGSKRLLWERRRALFYDYRLDSMRALFEALFYGFEKSRPILSIDSSYTSLRTLPGRLEHSTRLSIIAGSVCPEAARRRFATRHYVHVEHDSTVIRAKSMSKSLSDCSIATEGRGDNALSGNCCAHFTRDQNYFEANLHKLTTPVTVMWGEKDVYINKEMGVEFANKANVELIVLPGLGHYPHLQSPQRTIEEIRAAFEKR